MPKAGHMYMKHKFNSTANDWFNKNHKLNKYSVFRPNKFKPVSKSVAASRPLISQACSTIEDKTRPTDYMF